MINGQFQHVPQELLKGADKRDEDALECLLALCRVLALDYNITQIHEEKPSWYNGRWTISVQPVCEQPTDFFVPRTQQRTYTLIGAGNPVDGLRGCIISYVQDLIKNGESYRNGFFDWWNNATSHDWITKEPVQQPVCGHAWEESGTFCSQCGRRLQWVYKDK